VILEIELTPDQAQKVEAFYASGGTCKVCGNAIGNGPHAIYSWGTTRSTHPGTVKVAKYCRLCHDAMQAACVARQPRKKARRKGA
jgi:hypothetical protein